LVEGVLTLAAAVREVAGIDVAPVLCFVGQKAPLKFTARGVEIIDETSLAGIVRQPGPLTPKAVSEIAGKLATAFRSAR
jgi:hypothetical protein